MTDDELFADIPHPADGADEGPFGATDRGPSPFAEGLNPDQLDAVVHESGPLLVIAGAGSGKTRVLTHRIAHLIHMGVHPSKILAITFTNKAAAEMREHVGVLVGPVVKTMWVSTFHSACVRILRANGDLLGYPRQFSIYDSADSNRLTGYVIRDLGLDAKRFTPRGVHGIISLWKNELVDPEEAQRRAQNIFDRKHADVYAEYQARLLKAGAMDFDDLLTNTVKLFREHPDVLEHYRQRFEHILVDEYQDTNQAQNEMVLLLADGHRNVCVVGDTDQCLPPGTLVDGPGGSKPIEQVAIGDVVWGAGGRRGRQAGTVEHVHEGRYDGHLVEIAIGGRRLTATPHHLVPARLAPQHDQWLVYLMFRADRGWRIGRTVGARPPSEQAPARPGRADQPGACRRCVDPEGVRVDGRGRVLRVVLRGRVRPPDGVFPRCRTLAGDERRLVEAVVRVDRHRIPSQTPDGGPVAASRLPPPSSAERARRSSINLTMFSDRRSTVGYHRVQWSSNRDDIAAALRDGGVELRPSKHRSLRYETCWKDYRQALADVKRVAEIGGLDVRRRLAHDGTTYDLIPISHVHPGMEMLVRDGNDWVAETVDSAEFVPYSGPVYDLEVDVTHTYDANGVLVHNSVYKFRGADFRNIIDFEEAFPDVTTVILDQNYRSTQTILDAANAVIDNNVERKPKSLWTDAGDGERIVRYHAEDEGDEATWVAGTARQLHADDATNFREMAVLYRTNAQSRVIEEAFMRLGVPYKVVGGTRFYDRREIKDAMAYLKAVVNPVDEVSVKRVLNTPKRGIGDASVAKLDAFAATEGIAFVDALRRADEAGVTGPAIRGIASFVDLLDHVAVVAADPEQGPGDVLQAAIDASGYLAELEAEDTVEAHSRIENLGELVGFGP